MWESGGGRAEEHGAVRCAMAAEPWAACARTLVAAADARAAWVETGILPARLKPRGGGPPCPAPCGAILHVLRRRDGAARTADLERGAYAARGWSAPPRAPDPPATTFEYEAVGACASAGRTDDGENGGRTAFKEKKAKKEKKRGSKWAEA